MEERRILGFEWTLYSWLKLHKVCTVRYICTWDIVMVDENLDKKIKQQTREVEENSSRREGMEQRSQTEYIEYELGGSEQEVDGTTRRIMIISDDVIDDVNSLKQLFINRHQNLLSIYGIN